MNLSEYYNTVMELSHGIVVTLDRDGRIVHGNSRFETVSGFQIGQIAGKDWFEVCVDAAGRQRARETFAAIVGEGVLGFMKGSLRSRDGRKVYIDWNMKPLLDSRHGLVSILCVGVDVTEHVERQRNLLREHARLVALNKELSCLHAMNRIVSDMDSELPDILREILAIIPPSFQHPESTGVRLVLDGKTLVSGDFSADAPCRLEQDVLVHKVKRGHLSVSLRGTAAGGEADAFLPTESELLGALAKHVGWIIAKREALAIKRNLERQLQHADRLAKIGQFAAGVAHELNEPLANILGFAQLIGRHPGLPSQCRSDLERIVAASLHAREVVRKLQLFARQKAPTVALVDLNRLVQDGMYFLESRCARQGVELARNLDPNQPQLRADPSQVQQVLVNLVVNALQAMPDGGRLTIQTECGAGTARLVVMDTGVGMDQETQRQMFVPFFTTKDVDQGTGLGLAVVHGIVTSHGGTITVTSDLGSGSRFCVELPSAGHAGEGA